ncbi:MAG: arylsulfatase [Planctomycetota bacterium]
MPIPSFPITARPQSGSPVPRRVVLATVVLALLGVARPHSAAKGASPERAASRPNVIVVLTDDAGWGDLSLHGNPNLSTPNLDAMAREGAQIRHFYVCAVCSPTRAELLTGRYHGRMGVYSTSSGGERINADEQTIAQRFKAAGYATAAYGKWHSGMQWPYHPNARGFDDFYGFCSGHWGNYFDPMLEHNGEIVRGKGFLVDDLTDHAMDFIDQQADTPGDDPFFIYLAINTPHSPMQVPQKYWDRFKDKEIVPDPRNENARRQDDQHTRAALAMCENIDDNMGRLLTHLRERQLDENTIVVYFNDNGPNGWRFNGGMRGRKGSTNEGGLRSPCLIRYPQQIRPGTLVDNIGGVVDLFPTLVDLAGLSKTDSDSEKPLDGISHAAALTGRPADSLASGRLLFSAWRNRATVRTARYRMHSDGSLYDIEKDPGEQSDLAKRRPDIASHLREQLERWLDTLPDQKEDRPFPIAHPSAEWTQLPARDASSTGGITRSNRFPNCTYFLNWNETTSEILWDVEALSEGDYEVQMYYACNEDQLGSTVELSIGESRTTAKIETAVESDFIGSPNDRKERAEGDVKRWGTMSLGKLHLSPGRAKLRLRATSIAKDSVAEMRLLMLRRVSE